MKCQQLRVGLRSGELEGQTKMLILWSGRSCVTFLVLWHCRVIHGSNAAVSLIKVEQVIIEDTDKTITIHHLILRKKIETTTTIITPKIPRLMEEESHLILAEWLLKTWEMLSSDHFSHCCGVQSLHLLVKLRHFFLMALVRSSYSAAVWLESFKPFWRWCNMRTVMFSSGLGWDFFSNEVVKRGFLVTSFCSKLSVALVVFHDLPGIAL